ncbi:hypothetical protein M407DRAFT_244143 [Tulasnella calospora MUT 4182]|uniref:EF-hand domain-containing protein n=1 Tax=Tulasnella calospora MUT 4182 TaxID=1051891 RepID=A0A0C3QG28_9AGAM|nr:hypothetical protein M407DRAFT_244143 [Tulasnella calospora MUT 4182]
MMYTPSSPEASDVEEVMEEEFEALPRSLKRKIDEAFDRAVREAAGSAPKAAEHPDRINQGKGKGAESKSNEEDLGGGFLPPEDDDMGGGGFIPMDTDEDGGGFIPADGKGSVDEDSAEPRTHIPLSLIPRALQILDLPQDVDVLTIFENAASGWSGQKVGEEDAVSRKDWRAVCAVLFEDPRDTGVKDDSLSPPPSSNGDPTGDRDGRDEMDEDDEEDEDAYAQSDDSEGEEDEADSDYGGGGAGKAVKRTTRSRGKARELSPDEDASGSGFITLTSRQKKECKAAFALFFPDVPENELSEQRLKIKEVADAAKTLKERMTTEEIVEMLEYFSTSPDKTMSLADFEQMCMRTGLA